MLLRSIRKTVLALVILGLGVETGLPQSAPDASAATYALLSRGIFEPEWSFTCTAFATEWRNNRTYLLTAGHCIEPRREYALIPDKEASEIMTVTVEKVFRKQDVAVFSVAEILNMVPLGHSPARADKVSIIGWPHGMGKFRYDGRISAAPSSATKNMLVVYVPGVEKGMSGSAVFCSNQGAVCGVVVGIYMASPAFIAAEPIYNATLPQE